MITDPSVIKENEVSSAVVDIITGAKKISRFDLSASDWQTICLRTFHMLRDSLSAFSLFSELRNGVYVCASGKCYFDRNKKIGDNTKFHDGLTKNIRCVMLARTKARVADKYDTRAWEELFLTQDGRFILLKSRNVCIATTPLRRVDADLSHIPDEKLNDFFTIDVEKGPFGLHYKWEELLNAILLFCQCNLEKKRDTLLRVEALTYAVKRVRESIQN